MNEGSIDTFYQKKINSLSKLFRQNTLFYYNPQIKIPCGLINYWPFNGNYSDVIGEADLNGGINYSLLENRFGHYSTALNLNAGYRQLPTSVYINGDFSVTFWAYLMAFTPFSRALILGNGTPMDNLIISFSGASDPTMTVQIFSGTSDQGILSASQSLVLNQWYYITITLFQNGIWFLINGELVGNLGITEGPRNVNRTLNYIGLDQFNSNSAKANVKIDDLKFFNRALSTAEILTEMNSQF